MTMPNFNKRRLLKIIYFVTFSIAVFFLSVVLSIFLLKKNIWPASEIEYLINTMNESVIADRFHFKKNVDTKVKSDDEGLREQVRYDYNKFDLQTGLLKVSQPEHLVDKELVLYSHGSAVSLVNKRGQEIHRWHYDDTAGYIQGMHLFPNGDLAFNFGLRLIYMNFDSKVLWERPGYSTHDIDAYKDQIYVVQHKKIQPGTPFPCSGVIIDYASGQYTEDFITVFDRKGNILREISVLNAICNSDHRGLLSMNAYLGEMDSTLDRPVFYKISKSEYAGTVDPLHLNSIYVITEKDALSFPYLSEGDLLVSFRNINTVAIIDKTTGLVKWSMAGSFIRQHEVNIINNKYLAVFDNLGNFYKNGASRIAFYDMASTQLVKSYSPSPEFHFLVFITGSYDVAPNGNVVTIDGERILEINESKGVVWAYYPKFNKKITTLGPVLSIHLVPCDYLDKVTCEHLQK